jgi:hypothetical protein
MSAKYHREKSSQPPFAGKKQRFVDPSQNPILI